MTDAEWHDLETILIDTGLDIRKAEDICLLLRYKPENVQRAFYLRCQGKTHKEISTIIGVNRSTITRYIQKCEGVYKYLCSFVHIHPLK